MTPIPRPDNVTARRVLATLLQQRNILAALQTLHQELGDVFRLPLPGFNAVMLVGPEANRFLLVQARDDVRWRAEQDPVTRLLRHGVLVEDGEVHDSLRHSMNPSLHRAMIEGYVASMLRATDQISATWQEGAAVDFLAEMRRIALLILTDTLFQDDFSPHLQSLWQPILRTIQYISPGPWLVLPGIPRPGYQRAIRQLDDYFYRLIAYRRAHPSNGRDLLGGLIASGMDDGTIRDQLLTMLIAGHDTSTALLAWAIYLLTTHPDTLQRVQEEVRDTLGSQAPTSETTNQLGLLDRVIKESLRLYPPIHLGSRVAATTLEFQEYKIPAGTRLLYSIYLTHRDKTYWPEPDRFMPERFAPEQGRTRTAYTYVPFGGGPRNCMGVAFAQVESRVVLARILQQFDLRFVGGPVRPHMGATLEPRPDVLVEVRRSG